MISAYAATAAAGVIRYCFRRICSEIMKKYPQRIREIIVERPEELYDIDSVENMEFLREHPAGSGHTDENTDRVFR